MGDGQIFFGTVSHPQWVQCPGGLQRVSKGFSEEIEFGDGGIWLEESAGSHAEFELTFPVAAAGEYEGVEAFGRFASREYGGGYLYFVDPMYQDLNLFAPQFAAPGLIESGWKNWGGTTPSFTDVGANSYGKPSRAAVWAITADANVQQGKAFTFLIPPGYTLHIGGSGAVTGTGAVVVLPVGDSASAVTLSSDASAPAFTNTVAGDSFSSATVYLTRTSSATSTVTVSALWAQILPDGESPAIARHLPGGGTTGLRFRGKALPETYFMTQGKLIGLSALLVEVEAWE